MNLLRVAGALAVAAACSSSSSEAPSGSSSGSSSAGSAATVTYWTSSTQAEISYIDAQFDEAHPGIKAVGQYIASADQSTAKEVAAIKSGTEPNVVIGQDPSALPLLAESGSPSSSRTPGCSTGCCSTPGCRRSPCPTRPTR